MAEHDRTPVYFGAMMARGERDEMVGYQAYRMERGTTKRVAVENDHATETGARRTFVGPVRETYAEAREDAWAARAAEKGE